MARDSQVLDLNSSYSYLLWCRDFSATSVLASIEGKPAGFVTAYLRSDAPDTLMVWQVAVNAEFRGQGIAARMLDSLVDQVSEQTGDGTGRPPVAWLETTITADNEASVALFEGFAHRNGTRLERTALFEDEHFPDDHDTEYLFRIGPLR